jgi:hypothetical protein
MFARVALFAHIQQTLFNVETNEPGRARSQMQKLSAGKFQFDPSLYLHITRSPRRRAVISTLES